MAILWARTLVFFEQIVIFTVCMHHWLQVVLLLLRSDNLVYVSWYNFCRDW